MSDEKLCSKLGPSWAGKQRCIRKLGHSGKHRPLKGPEWWGENESD